VECYQKLLKKEQKDGIDPNNQYSLVRSNETALDLTKSSVEIDGVYGNAAFFMNEINFIDKKNVFILANMGLWYNDEVSYLAALPPVLRWLLTIAQRKKSFGLDNVIAWHETLRQHWFSAQADGYFSDSEVAGYVKKVWETANYSTIPLQDFVSPFSCAKISNLSDWRNDLLRAMYEEDPSLQKYLTILPMADITK
jgi:hypothetical protein